MGAIRYRVEQFLRAVTARRSLSQESNKIEQMLDVLPPAGRELFYRQAPQDQRHALDVCETLHQAGYTNPDLMAAALLHDVGKAAAQLPAWVRGVLVLSEQLAPRVLGDPLQSYEPFGAYAEHAEIGARWAKEAGCSPLTVALIRRHQEDLTSPHGEEERLLAALQAADRQC
jgi:hypothetical protein